MKKYFILVLFITIFLSACGSKPVTTIIQNNNTNSLVNEVVTPITISGEIENPGLTLPADINPGQIQKYFQLKDIYYALVMQSSMNILLETPTGFKSQFVGVLRANKEDTAWTKFIEIKDNNATDKNNPYYIWPLKNQLRLAVVDQNGAGSGEGIMKLFLIADDKATLSGCYYYPGSDSAADYFVNTKNFSQFALKPLNDCNTVQIILSK